LKIDRIGHVHDAMRASLSFSVQAAWAAATASFPVVKTSPAALSPAPALLKNPRRSSPTFLS
jgi:hypothetical protein